MGKEPELISSMTDPVRSRMFFLDVLSAAHQTAYLDELISEMEHYLGKTKDHLGTVNEDDDACAYLGSLGAVRIAEARLEWLREVVTRIRTQSGNIAKGSG